MSSETLSQDAIDAILGPGGAKEKAKPEVHLYDFRRPHRISKDRLRTLEAMYDRMITGLEGWLIGRTRTQLELKLDSIEQFSFGEFGMSLPKPCAAHIFEIVDAEAHGVVDFGAEFSYFLIDRLFGGSGEVVVPDRSHSPIEQMAIRVIAERVLAGLEEIWADYVPMEFALSGFEPMPEMLQTSNREDPVLVANVQITGKNLDSLMLISLPFNVLERFFAGSLHKRKAAEGSERRAERNRLQTAPLLRNTTVPLSVHLPTFSLSLRALAALEPGSVMTTGIPLDAPVEARVSDQPRFEAASGRIGNKLAIRITGSRRSVSPAMSNDDSYNESEEL